VRAEANRKIEALRADGKLGSSLQAEVVVKAGPATRELLATLGDDLRFVLITSAARVEPLAAAADANEFFVDAEVTAAAKCERCWHYRSDVGHDPAHPTICGRCTANLFGAGEPRSHA
jgi:isoleucyl-tRNA synthetase